LSSENFSISSARLKISWVAVRPAETNQIVHDGVRYIAHVAVGEDIGGTVAFC